MNRTDSPATRAYAQLMDVARADAYGGSDARLFALTWLAAARMVTLGKAPGFESLDKLTELDGWKALFDAGFPPEAIDLGSTQRAVPGAHEMARRAAAVSIVADLHQELGAHPWDVLPCIVESGARRAFEYEGAILPELVELLLDLVGQPTDGLLWIPFDASGQLTIGAFRRGWTVIAASPLAMSTLVLQLLLTIETGLPQHERVKHEVERDAWGRPVTRADYVLGVPPFGVQVRDSRLAHWDFSGGRSFEQFARSETWAIHEFVNRANKRAVLVAPQGVLFAKGQEQRLREYLIHRGGERNELEAVVALPPGVFAATAIAGAILVVNPGGGGDATRMVELRSGRRSLSEAAVILAAGREVALGLAPSADRAKLVSRDEIGANEYSFAPSRYLRRVADLGTRAVPLGDLCVAIRPPTTVKEPTPDVAFEVGMQDLNSWRPLQRRADKTVYLRGKPKESALVQPGDVVFSIKGTVGKAALVGGAAEERPTVVSQSCLALRLPPEQRTKNLSPEYLLMYLRSSHGQSQLEGLQVGAGVQHISPSTLMSSVLVPIPTVEEYREVREDYDRLCRLEHQVAELEGEMADLARRRWATEA